MSERVFRTMVREYSFVAPNGWQRRALMYLHRRLFANWLEHRKALRCREQSKSLSA